jgi:5'-nucleotidase
MFNWDTVDDALFDMDGTLLDLSWDLWFWLIALPHAMSKRLHITSADAVSRVHAHTHRHSGKLSWYSLETWRAEFGVDVAALHREHVHRTVLHKDAIPLLQLLRARGKRIGIITNADVPVLEQKREVHQGLFQLVDFSISSAELGHAKEDRRCWDALDTWLTSQDMMPINRARAFYADDNISVLKSLLAAGLNVDRLFYIRQPEFLKEPRSIVRDFPCAVSISDLFPDLG